MCSAFDHHDHLPARLQILRAGKSTLLKLIDGLNTPTRGRIEINGQRLDKLLARAPR